MISLFASWFNKAQNKWHITVGSLLVASGVALLTPAGWGLLVRALLARSFQLNLVFESDKWTGWALIILGLFLISIVEVAERRHTRDKRLLLFRQHSLPQNLSHINSNQLVRELSGYSIEEFDCDQREFFLDGTIDVVAALRKQKIQLRSLFERASTSDRQHLAFCGLAHIPLVFASGAAFGSTSNIRLFEHWSKKQQWEELATNGTPLSPFSGTLSSPRGATTSAISLSISFLVENALIGSLIAEPYDLHSIALPTPRRDAIYAYSQLHEISQRFRVKLDELTGQTGREAVIHLFYAGPMPLAFELGRQISPSLHRPVRVYNYSAGSVKGYNWSVVVNRDNFDILYHWGRQHGFLRLYKRLPAIL
jgi:hypothetical protein